MRWSTQLLILLIKFVVFQGVAFGEPCVIDEGNGSLPSWNEGIVKKKLMEYVKGVTDVKSLHYVKPEDRIAVLDLDGTLMAEEPVNFQRAIAVKRLKEMATANSELRTVQPYKSAWEDDSAYYNNVDNHSFVYLKAFKNFYYEDYVKYVEDFLKTQKAPFWGVSFEELFYKPSLELVKFLRDHGFAVYVCSTTEEGCIRLLLEKVLDIKPHKVIGNEVAMCFNVQNEGCSFIMKDEFIKPENRKEGKCRYILNRIGKRPIFACGNSMGDYAMLMYTKHSNKQNFVMVIDHDDPKRELEYHSDELLNNARKDGWMIVSMKNDFKRVF